jgi:hypothetical protein
VQHSRRSKRSGACAGGTAERCERGAGRGEWTLDAMGGVALSDAERASLAWLAGFEAYTVENVAAMITRARQTR